MSAMSDVFLFGGDCVEDVNTVHGGFLLLERERRVHDTDSLLHEFLLVFHKSSVIWSNRCLSPERADIVCEHVFAVIMTDGGEGNVVQNHFADIAEICTIRREIRPLVERH